MPTIQSLLHALYADWELQGRKSTYHLKSSAKPVETYFGKLDAAKLKQGHLQEYKLKRKIAGMANGTINREMAILRRAYRLALEAEIVDHMPVFRALKETNVRQGTYTSAEVDRLMAELPVHIRPVIKYAYLTGRRRGEILALRWDDVDLGRKLITVRQSTNKAGVPDTVPLEGELLTLMLDLWEAKRESCPWVFNYKGQPMRDFTRTFQRARERAGLPDRLFHDFRRTVATDLIEAGYDQSVAMRVTGHKTSSMFQRYNIVPMRAVRSAMAGLTEFRKEKGETNDNL